MCKIRLSSKLTTVTSFSKIVALILFVSLPFIGFTLGKTYQKSIDYVSLHYLDFVNTQYAKVKSDYDSLLFQQNQVSKEPEGKFKVYESSKLGVVFSYYQYASGDLVKAEVKVAEIDNKIYLYVGRSKAEPVDPTKGKYIEVLSKSPNQSLKESIESSVLKGYDLRNCTVDTTYNKNIALIKPTYEYAVINYNSTPEDTDYQMRLKKAQLCNLKYNSFNGVGYFVMDKKHPDKFAFVSLGQDNFAFPVLRTVNPVISWDDTLTLID